MSEREPVEITIDQVLVETKAAYLCRVDVEQIWLPKSQIIDGMETMDTNTTDSCTISIPEWLAIEKDLV